LGETPEEEEERMRREQEAAATTPEARAAQAAARAAQTRFENETAEARKDLPGSVRSLRGQQFSKDVASGVRTIRTPPGQWGQFEYARTGRPDNYRANAPDQLGWDIARLGAYFLGGGPAAEVTRRYLPKDIGNVLLNPSNLVDEAADQIIPGGSGVSGGSLLPYLDNSDVFSRVSGEDKFYPSETIQSGSRNDGYRGVTNSGNTGIISGLIDNQPGYPLGDLLLGGTGASPAGTGAGASPAGTGASYFGEGIRRPDSYRGLGIERPASTRTDDVMGQLQALFAGEQRQGPSEAEALLHQATDRAAGQALGIAAGARGGAGARARARSQAIAANAALGSRASQDVAALRAREDAERRARQAQIMGLISGAAQGADARDLAYAEADQRARAAADNLDLGYTQADVDARLAAASLANSAYQSEADRALRETIFAAQDRTFIDRLKRDPIGTIGPAAGKIVSKYFGF